MKNETSILNNTYFKNGVFIIILLFSLHFWDLEGIPFLSFTIENSITLLVCVFSVVMVWKEKNLRFRNAIILFVIGVLANCFAAYINIGQSLKLSFLSCTFYYFILLYFVLHYLKIERKFAENTVIVFALLYSILFYYQYRTYPNIIFNNDPLTATNELQLEIIGHGFLVLGYLLVFNRFLINHRIINIFLALWLLFILTKCGFRTLIVGAVVVSVFMVIKQFRFRISDLILMIFVGLFFVGLSQYPSIAKMIDNMVTKTQGDVQEGDNYVRNIDIEFFYKRYPKNFSYFIIGGGKPAGSNLYTYDPYAMGINYSGNYNIIWVDIGLLGFYIVVGGIATAGVIWYTIKAIFARLPMEKYYLSFYFLYLLIVSITNEEMYRNGIFSVHAIALYLIDVSLKEKSKSEDETALQQAHSPTKK